METRTFYYRNNSFRRSYDNYGDAYDQAKKEHNKYSIRLETWTFDELVERLGKENALHFWNRGGDHD